MAESFVSARWIPKDHERVEGSVIFGSKMLRLFAVVAPIGYTGADWTQAAVTAPAGQIAGGPRREASRSSIGHDSPGYTRLPFVTLRLAVVVPPGFAP
jgi:hypothetical protein